MIGSSLLSLQKRGAILIIVLWISTGLVTVALLFGQSMMLSYRAGENTLAGMQAEHAIEGALRYAQYALRNGDYGEFDPEEDTLKTASVSTGEARFWFLGRDPNLQTIEQADYPVFGLVDEASKLNLNTATLEMLEKLPDMTPELAAAIIDWRDEDEEITEGGAESETYGLRRPSFPSKNAPFETLEELLILHHSDWNILYGEDTNQNGFLDRHEQDGAESLPLDDQNRILQSGILDFVTVHSRQSNLNDQGEAKINITGDNAEELVQLLQERLGSERAAELSVGGQADNLLAFYTQSRMTAAEFAQIDQELGLSDEPYTEGLVNINTARYEVLVCLPGLDEESAQELVNYRRSNPDQLTSVAWVAEVLDQAAITQVGEWITTQSYQYSVDTCAVGSGGKGFRRVKYILDYSGGTPVVRYRKDMTRQGWALGPMILKELRLLKESGNEFL